MFQYTQPHKGYRQDVQVFNWPALCFGGIENIGRETTLQLPRSDLHRVGYDGV